MMKPTEELSQESKDNLARAIFEKIMTNSEEIGKMKMQPFNVQTVERCRAMFRENDKLFIQLSEVLSK